MRAVSAMLAGLCAVLTVGGCPVIEPAPRADPTAVTQQLRGPCWAYSEGELRAILLTFDQLRADGMTRSDAFSFALFACEDFYAGNEWDCTECQLEIVNQIYGPAR